jgi:hypothetical protein
MMHVDGAERMGYLAARGKTAAKSQGSCSNSVIGFGGYLAPTRLVGPALQRRGGRFVGLRTDLPLQHIPAGDPPNWRGSGVT